MRARYPCTTHREACVSKEQETTDVETVHLRVSARFGATRQVASRHVSRSLRDKTGVIRSQQICLITDLLMTPPYSQVIGGQKAPGNASKPAPLPNMKTSGQVRSE